MRWLSIIKEDNHVYIDGQMMTVDCSSLPDDFHALQWDNEKGEGWVEPVGHNGPNQKVTDLSPYQKFIDGWLAEEARLKGLAKAQQLEIEQLARERAAREEEIKVWEQAKNVYTATDKAAFEAFYDEETGTFKPSHTS